MDKDLLHTISIGRILKLVSEDLKKENKYDDEERKMLVHISEKIFFLKYDEEKEKDLSKKFGSTLPFDYVTDEPLVEEILINDNHPSIDNYIIEEIRSNDNKKWLVKTCRDKGIKQSRWCIYQNFEEQPESKVVNKNTLKLNIFRWHVGREPYEDEQMRMNISEKYVDYFIKK
jgi:hypothetical protein